MSAFHQAEAAAGWNGQQVGERETYPAKRRPGPAGPPLYGRVLRPNAHPGATCGISVTGWTTWGIHMHTHIHIHIMCTQTYIHTCIETCTYRLI